MPRQSLELASWPTPYSAQIAAPWPEYPAVTGLAPASSSACNPVMVPPNVTTVRCTPLPVSTITTARLSAACALGPGASATPPVIPASASTSPSAMRRNCTRVSP